MYDEDMIVLVHVSVPQLIVSMSSVIGFSCTRFHFLLQVTIQSNFQYPYSCN